MRRIRFLVVSTDDVFGFLDGIANLGRRAVFGHIVLRQVGPLVLPRLGFGLAVQGNDADHILSIALALEQGQGDLSAFRHGLAFGPGLLGLDGLGLDIVGECRHSRLFSGILRGHGDLYGVRNRLEAVIGRTFLDPVVAQRQAGEHIALGSLAILADGHSQGRGLAVHLISGFAIRVSVNGEAVGFCRLCLDGIGSDRSAVLGDRLGHLQGAGLIGIGDGNGLDQLGAFLGHQRAILRLHDFDGDSMLGFIILHAGQRVLRRLGFLDSIGIRALCREGDGAEALDILFFRVLISTGDGEAGDRLTVRTQRHGRAVSSAQSKGEAVVRGPIAALQDLLDLDLALDLLLSVGNGDLTGCFIRIADFAGIAGYGDFLHAVGDQLLGLGAVLAGDHFVLGQISEGVGRLLRSQLNVLVSDVCSFAFAHLLGQLHSDLRDTRRPVGRAVRVLPGLLNGQLGQLGIRYAAGQARLVRILGECDLAGFGFAGQAGQNGGAIFAFPDVLMGRGHGEGNRVDGVIAFGRLGFSQDVVAVVEALRGEGRAVGGQGDFLRGAVRQLLLQLELSAGQRGARFIRLADIQLVGEDDDGIILGFAFIRIIRAGRVVAVSHASGIDIAYIADNSFFSQFRVEEHLDRCTVQCRVSNVSAVIASPSKGQNKVIRVFCCEFIVSNFAVTNLNTGNLVELKTKIQTIDKGDVVLLVAGHVTGQGRGQLEGHFIADIVVRAVPPIRLDTRGVVDVHDLLLEGRLSGLRIGDGDEAGCFIRLADRADVAGNSFFLHTVLDLGQCAVFVCRVLRQIMEGIFRLLPRQRLGINDFCSFADLPRHMNRDFNAFRPYSVSTVRVLPDLFNRELHQFQIVGELGCFGELGRLIDARFNGDFQAVLTNQLRAVGGGIFGNGVFARRQAGDDDPAGLVRRQGLRFFVALLQGRGRGLALGNGHFNSSGIPIRSRDREAEGAVRQCAAFNCLAASRHRLEELQAAGLLFIIVLEVHLAGAGAIQRGGAGAGGHGSIIAFAGNQRVLFQELRLSILGDSLLNLIGLADGQVVEGIAGRLAVFTLRHLFPGNSSGIAFADVLTRYGDGECALYCCEVRSVQTREGLSHGQLAQLLVRVLGSYRVLTAAVTNRSGQFALRLGIGSHGNRNRFRMIVIDHAGIVADNLSNGVGVGARRREDDGAEALDFLGVSASDGDAGDRLAVRTQRHGCAVSSAQRKGEAVVGLPFAAFQGLLDLDLGHDLLLGIGNGDLAVIVRLADRADVAFDFDFFDAVDDLGLGAVGSHSVLRQVREGVGRLLRSQLNLLVSDVCSFAFAHLLGQLHSDLRDTRRPGVRAVRVDPGLFHGQGGQLGVDDLFLVERVVLSARVGRLVVLDRALDDPIGVELARLGLRRVAVLIELGELVSVAFPRRGDVLDLFPSGVISDLRVGGAAQLQGDLGRVGMLFLVHPNLGTGDLRLFLGIGVGHGHGADAGSSVDGDLRRGRFFFFAVVRLDLGDTGVAGDAFGVASIGLGHGVDLARQDAVRLGQFPGTIGKLIIGLGLSGEALAGYSEGNIFLLLVRQCRAGEALGDGQAGGLFRVGDGVAVRGIAADRGGELAADHTGHARFDHTVGDRGRGHGAVCINGNCVLGQGGELVARLIRRQGQLLTDHRRGSITLAAVQLHLNSDALRPILAFHLRHRRRIRKRPGLVHGDLGRFFLVGDGDGGLVGALHRITNLGGVAGNLDFLHAVDNVGPLSFSVLFLRGQVLKGVSGMRRRQLSLDRRLRFAFALHDGLAIGSQLHGDLYTSRPGVRAVRVHPLLVDFDIGYFNSIGESSGSGIRQRIIDARNNRYRLGILAFHPGAVFGGGFGNGVRAFRQARDDEPAILRRQVLLIGCRIQDRRGRNAIADSDHHNSGVIIRSRNREGVFAVRHLQRIAGRLIVIDLHLLGQLQGAGLLFIIVLEVHLTGAGAVQRSGAGAFGHGRTLALGNLRILRRDDRLAGLGDGLSHLIGLANSQVLEGIAAIGHLRPSDSLTIRGQTFALHSDGEGFPHSIQVSIIQTGEGLGHGQLAQLLVGELQVSLGLVYSRRHDAGGNVVFDSDLDGFSMRVVLDAVRDMRICSGRLRQFFFQGIGEDLRLHAFDSFHAVEHHQRVGHIAKDDIALCVAGHFRILWHRIRGAFQHEAELTRRERAVREYLQRLDMSGRARIVGIVHVSRDGGSVSVLADRARRASMRTFGVAGRQRPRLGHGIARAIRQVLDLDLLARLQGHGGLAVRDNHSLDRGIDSAVSQRLFSIICAVDSNTLARGSQRDIEGEAILGVGPAGDRLLHDQVADILIIRERRYSCRFGSRTGNHSHLERIVANRREAGAGGYSFLDPVVSSRDLADYDRLCNAVGHGQCGSYIGAVLLQRGRAILIRVYGEEVIAVRQGVRGRSAVDGHRLGDLQGAVGLILVGKDRFGHNLLFNCAGITDLRYDAVTLNRLLGHGIAYAKRKSLDGRLLAGQQGNRGRVIRNSDGRGIALASRVDDEGILAIHFAAGESNGEGEGRRLHVFGQVFRQHLLELHVAGGDLAVGDGQRTVVRIHNAFAVVGIGDFVVLGGDRRLLLNRVGQGVGDTVLNESSIQFFKCIGPAVFFGQGAFEAGAFFHGFALLVGLDHKQLDQDLVRLFVAVRIELLMNLDAGGLGFHLVGHGDRAGRDARAVIGIGRGIVVDPLFNDGVLDGLCVLHRGQLGPDVIRPGAVRADVDGYRLAFLFLRAVRQDLVKLQLDAVRRAGLEQVVTVVHPALGGGNGGILLLDIGRGPCGQVRHRRDTNIVRRLAGIVQGPGNFFVFLLYGIGQKLLRDMFGIIDVDMLIEHEVMVFIAGGVA